MKLTTLEKILWSLEDMQYAIEVDEEVRERALTAVERMVAIG
jgi:quinolinate synthase